MPETVQQYHDESQLREAKKRAYPTNEGWQYLTIDNLPPGSKKEQVVKNITGGFPELYELAYWARCNCTAFVIIRRKPVNNSQL